VRGYVYRHGATYWMQYYVDGRRKRESTGQVTKREAERVLNERLARLGRGVEDLPRLDRLTYQEAAADLRTHYATSGERDLAEAAARLKHLDAFFAHWRLAAISGVAITDYVAARQAQGAANGTINRELGVLGRLLRLAYENKKLDRLPVMRKPKEAAPRAGFFEDDQYAAVRRHLPADLQVAVAIQHEFGWRNQSEVMMLERRHLDLDAGTLLLDPGMAKNEDGRFVYLTPDLKRLLTEQFERIDALQRRLGRIIPWLFPHLSGRDLGERRRDFRRAWTTACKRAGVPGRLRHDFRRTAVRNLVQAGVPERVAMTITGHKTCAVFDRYHIVSPADLREAAQTRCREGRAWPQDSHKIGSSG
jgi:integrase